VQALAQRDPNMLAWWGSAVECASALARLERDALLDSKSADVAFQRLQLITDAWHEVEPSEFVRENAIRFLRVHKLRAADAACRGIRCGRTASRIASGGYVGRTPCRGDAEGRVRVGRH
jgi:hypothetical protein